MGRFAVLVGTAALAVTAMQASADSLGDFASQWLAENMVDSDELEVTFSRQKLTFKGCKQRQYSLSVARQLTRSMEIEGTLFYGKGVSGHGLLNQTVASQGYEIISWLTVKNYRFGLGHKTILDHDITAPMADPVALPTSKAISLHAEVPGFDESHRLSMALVKETWRPSDAPFSQPWDTAADHQLQLHYNIAF